MLKERRQVELRLVEANHLKDTYQDSYIWVEAWIADWFGNFVQPDRLVCYKRDYDTEDELYEKAKELLDGLGYQVVDEFIKPGYCLAWAELEKKETEEK